MYGAGSQPTMVHESLPALGDDEETQMLVQAEDFEHTPAMKAMLKTEDANRAAALSQSHEEKCSFTCFNPEKYAHYVFFCGLHHRHASDLYQLHPEWFKTYLFAFFNLYRPW